MTSPPSCPRCGSAAIVEHHTARKTCSAVGGIAGAGASLAAAWDGARGGMTLGRWAGPAGLVFGGITGTIVGACLGGAAGCAAGAVLGSAIDEHILDQCECQSCGHRFSSRDTLAVNDLPLIDRAEAPASHPYRSVPVLDYLRTIFKTTHAKE